MARPPGTRRRNGPKKSVLSELPPCTLTQVLGEWVGTCVSVYEITGSIPRVASVVFLKMSRGGVRSLDKPAVCTGPARPIWQLNFL